MHRFLVIVNALHLFGGLACEKWILHAKNDDTSGKPLVRHHLYSSTYVCRGDGRGGIIPSYYNIMRVYGYYCATSSSNETEPTHGGLSDGDDGEQTTTW